MTGSASTLLSVSFVVPVRNDARRLRVCLNSIARNLYPTQLVEVIVVDNQSTDDSAQVAHEAGARVISTQARNVADLRNIGVGASSGAVVAFVDADHEIACDWIRSAVLALSSGPNIAAVGALCHPPADANWVQQAYNGFRSRAEGRQDASWLGSGNLVVRRDAFDAVGGFDVTLESCEDVDLCNRLCGTGLRILDDPALRNVHFGDPTSLPALFRGELWRGRDNLKVTLRGPRTLRHLRSALIPIADLGAVLATCLLLPFVATATALLPLTLVTAIVAARAWTMARRRADRSSPLPFWVRCFVVALVYDAARASALVVRTSHRTRRLEEASSHVPANSHS